MKLALPALALALAAACSQPAIEPSPRAIDVVPTGPLPKYTNLPEFSTLQAAIDFATQEKNLLGFEGIITNSETFDVELPSGGTIGNYVIDCFYRQVFRQFGEDAYPFLTPLLDHEHTFVQVGAYSVMNSAMFKHGLTRKVRHTREERVATMHAFEAILAAKSAGE